MRVLIVGFIAHRLHRHLSTSIGVQRLWVRSEAVLSGVIDVVMRSNRGAVVISPSRSESVEQRLVEVDISSQVLRVLVEQGEAEVVAVFTGIEGFEDHDRVNRPVLAAILLWTHLQRAEVETANFFRREQSGTLCVLDLETRFIHIVASTVFLRLVVAIIIDLSMSIIIVKVLEDSVFFGSIHLTNPSFDDHH